MKLNLGFHKWRLAGFINIDIDPSLNPDVVADAAHLPYPDNSVEEIYAGHMLEHFDMTEDVLKEWHRVLQPGGIITITVPDMEKGLKEYREGNITLDWLNQIVFGAPDRIQQEHHQIFTEDILLKDVRKYFNKVHIVEDSPYLVARVKWQTICKATK